MLCAEGDKEKGIKGVAPSGKPHPANPAACEEESPTVSPVPNEQQQIKTYAHVIQRRSQIPSQAGSKIWQLWLRVLALQL